MKHESKFREEENEEQRQIQQEAHARETVKDFESVEDLLRFDASGTNPPDALRNRLHRSLQTEEKKSWWSRMFGAKE